MAPRDSFLPSFDSFTGQYRDRIGPGVQLTPGASGMVPSEEPGIVGGGIRAGFNELQGLGGDAFSALGQYLSNPEMIEAGRRYAERNFGEAAEFGRPDLEVAPWKEGGSPWLPYIGYQVSKQVPLLAGITAANLVTGGGATALGAGAAGARLAGSLGAGAFTSGTGLGAIYGEARERGDPTFEDAKKAFALAPLYGAAEALVPLGLGRVARGARLPGLLGRSRKAAFAEALGGAAIGEMGTEAVQTSMELSVRDDLSSAEKAERIVDAALTGGLVGGALGGGAGAINAFTRAAREKPASSVTNDDMKFLTDQTIRPGSPQQPGGQQIEGPQAAPQVPAPNVFERGRPLTETPDVDVDRDVGMLAERIQNGRATAQELQAFDAVKQERAARQERRGRAPDDASVVMDMAEQQAIDKTRKKVRGILKKDAPIIRKLTARNSTEAGSQILDALERGDDSKATIQLAEMLGLIDENGMTIDQRDTAAEIREAEAELAESVRRRDLARTTEQKKKFGEQAQRRSKALTELKQRIQFATSVQNFRAMDREAGVQEMREGRPGTTQAEQQPIAGRLGSSIPLDRMREREQQAPERPVQPPEAEAPQPAPEQPTLPGFEYNAGPRDSVSRTAMAGALSDLQATLSQRQTREAEFEAATTQRDEASRERNRTRATALAAWDRLNDGGKTTFEQLTPEAQQEWIDRVETGRYDMRTFRRLRQRRRRTATCAKRVSSPAGTSWAWRVARRDVCNRLRRAQRVLPRQFSRWLSRTACPRKSAGATRACAIARAMWTRRAPRASPTRMWSKT